MDECVPTKLGERYSPGHTRQQQSILNTKHSSSSDFLASVGQQVGVLRYLNTVKADRTCRRFLQRLLREMDEDEEDEEQKMNNYIIIKRRVQWFWKGEWNESWKNDMDYNKKR